MTTDAKILDSVVWILIPRSDLDNTQYREWIDMELIPDWLKQEGNPNIKGQDFGAWGEPEHVKQLNIGGRIDYFSIEKRDMPTINSRCLMISKGFDYREVIEIHRVADSLEGYLKRKNIEYSRRNFYRRQEFVML